MVNTILVVDDTASLRKMVKSYLSQEGFEVVTAADGPEALMLARQTHPDLIVLDLMMPEMGGMEFLRAYAKEGTAPIIVLTAKLEEHDKILGLELGADDYMTKPFSPRELAARVRAVLRRTRKSLAEPTLLRVGGVTLDRTTRVVTVAGRRVDLTPSEFDLLATLMLAPGRVFTRTDLLDRVQGTTYEGFGRAIDVHISNLRSKIEANTRHPRYIETVFGIGYCFAAQE